MLLLQLQELHLSRPVRLLHPRLPVYVVPRGAGLFMVGATMLESDDDARISARSMLELLSAAYALHPAFGEAHILEIGTGGARGFSRQPAADPPCAASRCTSMDSIGTAFCWLPHSPGAWRRCCSRAALSGGDG